MNYVFDTSAMIEFLHGRSYRVAELFQQAKRGECQIYLSFMTLFELTYQARLPPKQPEKDSVKKSEAREFAALKLLQDLKSLPFTVFEETESLRWNAANFKAIGGLSPADAYILATTQSLNATLVHQDAEYRKFREVLQEEI